MRLDARQHTRSTVQTSHHTVILDNRVPPLETGAVPTAGCVRRGLILLGLTILLCTGVADQTLADGFHNAALVTKSLEEWLNDVKQAIPDLDERMSGTELHSGRDVDTLKKKAAETKKAKGSRRSPRRAGTIESDLTPQQRALLGRKADDCMQILAYMDPKNIIPREFPDFQLGKIPDYRKAAKKLLGVMGPEGTNLVATRLREELMGTALGDPTITKHEKYYDDMLEVLNQGLKTGNLSAQQMKDLLEATQGKKDPVRAALARKVQQSLALDKLDTSLLIEIASRAKDIPLRRRAQQALNQRIADASVLQLLKGMAVVNDKKLRQNLEAELRTRSPKYSDIQGDLAEIWKLTASDDRIVAQAARDQTANAFQRAPIAQCLKWLEKDDKELSELIWQQLDGRIARADAERKAEYGKVGVAIVEHWEAPTASRLAALELLARLKDRRFAKPLIEVLPKLPREMWAKTGETLQRLTGQNFGPNDGDGIAEAVEAQKRWQEWWVEQQQKDGGK